MDNLQHFEYFKNKLNGKHGYKNKLRYVTNDKEQKRYLKIRHAKLSKKWFKQEKHKGKIYGMLCSNLPYINVHIGIKNIPALCLVDSGCSSVICNLEFYKYLEEKNCASTLTPWDGYIKVANNQPLQVSGVTSIKIKIGPFSWKVQSLVISDLKFDLVVGTPFMEKCQMVLDFYSHNCYFKFKPNIKIPIILKKAQGSHSMEIKVGNEEMRPAVEQLISKYSAVFSDKIGRALDYEIKLELLDPEPVKIRPYYMAPPTLKKVNEIIADWEKQDIVEKCTSPYSSPAFLVKGERLVIDYTMVNRKMRKIHFPLGDLNNIYTYLSQAKIFSVVDLKSSFFADTISSREPRPYCLLNILRYMAF